MPLFWRGRSYTSFVHFTLISRLKPLNSSILQGISDTPAWIVTRANQYARDHGKTPFAIYQGLWSVMHRDIERDILPMVKAEGMALAPWNVLASGKIRSDEQERQRRETGEKGEFEIINSFG